MIARYRRSVALLAALLLMLSLGNAARAADIEDAVNALASASFDDTITAVERLAATGDPRAVPVLEALIERNLYRLVETGRVVIAEQRGNVLVVKDPLTLEAIGDLGIRDAERLRVNNKLRNAIRAALGSLTLLSPDPGVRRAAADAIFKSRTAENAAMLEHALEREDVAAVRKRLEVALAAVRLVHAGDTQVRIDALDVLAGSADREVRSLVAQVLVEDSGGRPIEADPLVREAAARALSAIDGRLELWGVAVSVFQGISLGSVLMLAAVGLAITFGVMGVINMAHGEMVMLGAYTTFVIQNIIRTHAPHLFDWSVVFAIPAAFVVAALVGIAIERGVIRFLYGRPLETLLATWGISLILQQTVRSIFGPTNREVGNPSWMSGAFEVAGGVAFTYNRIWIIVFSLVVFALLMVVIRRTSFGLRMRAVTQNRPMAASMGIRTGRIDALTFALGSGVAGLAGVALSQIDNVSPNLGQAYIIDSFLVVVFGGVGNLWGTFVGGFSLGLVNKFLEPHVGAVLGKILVLVAVILFIQKRPRGLFALKGRAVET